MRLQFEQIREISFPWDENVRVDPADFNADSLQELSSVHWKGEISYVAPNFLVRASVRYEQTLLCDRCLETYKESIEKEIAVMVEQRRSRDTIGEVELTEGDLGIYQVAGDTVETRNFLLEEIGLNLPMKPICSPNCRGLCAQCGELLGEEEHHCSNPAIDPRWQALADLKIEN